MHDSSGKRLKFSVDLSQYKPHDIYYSRMCWYKQACCVLKGFLYMSKWSVSSQSNLRLKYICE